jgi:hypothetical protein
MSKQVKIWSFYLIFFLSKNLQSQVISYEKFIAFKSKLSTIDSIMDNGNYKKSIRKLNKISEMEVPIGYRKSYYAKLGECYLQLNNLEISGKNYLKSFEYGLFRSHFDYLLQNIDMNDIVKLEFIYDLKFKYDSLSKKKENEDYLKMRDAIIKICNDDQSVRYKILNSTEQSPEILDSLNAEVGKVDSINQVIFDSLSTVYGWIGRNLIKNDFRNIQIVLYHAPKEFRDKYVKKGYDLAKANLVDWKEVQMLQSYCISRNIMLDKNESTVLLKLENKSHIDSDFFMFLCYSLCFEINDGGLYNNKEKKVLIQIDFGKDSNNLKRKMKRYFKRFGLKKDKYKFTKKVSTNDEIIVSYI